MSSFFVLDFLPVRVQAGGRGESLVADLADVRLLPRVRPHVSLEQAGSVKGLPADGARKHRFLSRPPPGGGAGGGGDRAGSGGGRGLEADGGGREGAGGGSGRSHRRVNELKMQIIR